jgi:hypothetical protein
MSNSQAGVVMALMHGDLKRLAARERWLEWYLQREGKMSNGIKQPQVPMGQD